MNTSNASSTKSRWNFRPDLSQQMAPYFDWPVKLPQSLRYFVASWSLLGVRIYVLAFSILSWVYFSPELIQCRTFSVDWMAQIWLRNFLTMLVVAGSLHLYFFTFNQQGKTEKYDPRGLSRHSKLFYFNDQVKDNMFWTLVSAVAVWSIYESVIMWLFANGSISMISIDSNPVWFVALLLLIPLWTGFHFYWQHRAFHIPFFYKLAPQLASQKHQRRSLVWCFYASARTFSLVQRRFWFITTTFASDSCVIYYATTGNYSSHLALWIRKFKDW